MSVLPIGERPVDEPAVESTDDKLDRVLDKLDRLERVIGALVDQLPVRWRMAVKGAWHG